MKFEDVFGDSYKRVLRARKNSRSFIDDFYMRFIASDTKVMDAFAGVSLERQKRMVKTSLLHLYNMFCDKEIDYKIEEVAVLHDKNHKDIPYRLFDTWLECLIMTVREFDPQFDKEVELSWRMVLSGGITFMKFKSDNTGESAAG